MSAISSISGNSPLYQPTSPIAGQSKTDTIAADKAAAARQAAATKAGETKSDPDGDGDSDGPGLDVNG
jgi:hypothetical protein